MTKKEIDRRCYLKCRREGRCKKCGKPAIKDECQCQICKDKNKIYGENGQRRTKLEALNHYGGVKCSCCGEGIIQFLSIDHINGGGNAHRRENKIRSIYRWLKRNGYPAGFQVLCHNCNHGKFLNGGICPHES